MAKKKKHEEHENLERWLVSYADFITLLFATFVVLYALSQVDLSEYIKLESAMKAAFSPSSVLSGMDNVVEGTVSESMVDATSADSVVSPLMLEYVSTAYEQQSYEEIKDAVDKAAKDGSLKGVTAEITERGLLLSINGDLIFNTGSATLAPKSAIKLAKIGALIADKFVLHYIRVEGHTDNQPISSYIYPSNWELSSARASMIVRFLIEHHKFMPGLFTAIGFADTRPIDDNKTEEGRAKNRRVDILVLRNKLKRVERPQIDLMRLTKEEQEDLLKNRGHVIKRLKDLSEAARALAKNDPEAEKNAIMLKHDATENLELNPGNKMLYDEHSEHLNVLDEKMFNVDFQE